MLLHYLQYKIKLSYKQEIKYSRLSPSNTYLQAPFHMDLYCRPPDLPTLWQVLYAYSFSSTLRVIFSLRKAWFYSYLDMVNPS